MPTPVYMICSRGGAVDKDTEAIHLFDVLEIIKIAPAKHGEIPPTHPDQMAKLRILAAWQMSIPDDLGKVFEAEVAVRFPGRESEFPEIVTAKLNDIIIVAQIQRVLVSLALAALPGPGPMQVECRLRQKGDTEWPWKQTYPMLLLEVAQPTGMTTNGVTPPPSTPP